MMTQARVYTRLDEPPPQHPAFVEFWQTHERYHPRDEWQRLSAILRQPPDVPLTDEQIDFIYERSKADPIPPCRVCGRALSFAGNLIHGQYTYACDGKIPDPERGENYIKQDPEWDPMNTSIGISMHREWSTFVQGNPGDALARRLVTEIRRSRGYPVEGDPELQE